MPRKGKGKGKRKVEDGSGLKNPALHFKRIDLQRFAYDVIKYIGLKFRVPESCIAVWKGSHNDYLYDDFFLSLGGLVIECQIDYRYDFHALFSNHYKLNKLASPELIGRLLQEVVDKYTEHPLTNTYEVVISLAAVCELFLFLHSNNVDLHPRRLAKFWFQSYLNLHKKEFEDVGGLLMMYKCGRITQFDDVDGFFDKFIDDFCLPYETSIRETLGDSYYQAVDERKEESDKIEAENRCANAMIRCQPSKPDGASGINVPQNTGLGIVPQNTGLGIVPQNTGLGIIPPDKELKQPGLMVASFLDPSAATPEEQQQRYRRYLTPKERREMIRSGLRACVQRDIRQTSSDTSEKKQSNVSAAKDTMPSYHLLGARPKTYGGTSQTDTSRSSSNIEQGSGQTSLENSGTEQYSK